MSAHRIARLIAVIAGIAGVVLCALVPLLPVKQTTATIMWPQAQGAAPAATSGQGAAPAATSGKGPSTGGLISDITVPLVSGAPQALDVSIPCRTIATLPAAGGLIFSTIPSGGIEATRNGLFVDWHAVVRKSEPAAMV